MENEYSPELEAMISSIGKIFPKVKSDRSCIKGLIDWAQEELKINAIPTEENELRIFGQYITEVLGPEDLNGQTKSYVDGIVTHYKLDKILYQTQQGS